MATFLPFTLKCLLTMMFYTIIISFLITGCYSHSPRPPPPRHRPPFRPPPVPTPILFDPNTTITPVIDTTDVTSDLIKESPVIDSDDNDTADPITDMIQESPVIDPGDNDTADPTTDMIQESPVIDPDENDTADPTTDMIQESPAGESTEMEINNAEKGEYKDTSEDTNEEIEETNRKGMGFIPWPTPIVPNITIIDMAVTESTTSSIPAEESKTPEEELHHIMENLDNLLSNDSVVITLTNVTDTFDQLDVLLEDDDIAFPTEVLHQLDELSSRAYLNGSQHVSAVGHNIAVVMADSDPQAPVGGLIISASDGGFEDNDFQIFNGNLDASYLSSETSDAVVALPRSVLESPRRISFVVFRSDRVFSRPDAEEQYVVNSKVISVNVENTTKLEDGEVIDIYLKPILQEYPRNQTRSCAYWHFSDNGTGHWSQEGCFFIPASYPSLLDTCRCDHLTHFAEVLVPKPVFSEENEIALEIISVLGNSLSIFGLVMISLTAILFESWRKDFNNKIWIQLSVALLINAICFLVIVFTKFEYYNIYCMLVGMTLHYSMLASFCWMLIAAVISYRKLVLIFARDPSRKLLKASLFSWLVPFTIVSLLITINPESYIKRFESMTPSGAFCYPSGVGLWLSVYTPITFMLMTNLILFSLIIRSVFATRTIQKHGGSSEALRRASVSCLLVFLFGLPWIFGLFASNIVAAYIFTFSTSLQGFVLFLFFIVVNKKTRLMWKDRLSIQQITKAPVSSSLPTGRSSGETGRDESEQAFIERNTTRTNVTFTGSSFGKNVAPCVFSPDTLELKDIASINGCYEPSHENELLSRNEINIDNNEAMTNDAKSSFNHLEYIQSKSNEDLSFKPNDVGDERFNNTQKQDSELISDTKNTDDNLKLNIYNVPTHSAALIT